MNQADIKANNEADVKALKKANTRSSNKVGIIIEPHSKDKIVSKVKSKVDIRDLYRLDLLFSKNNHTKNLLFCNFVVVLVIFLVICYLSQ